MSTVYVSLLCNPGDTYRPDAHGDLAVVCCDAWTIQADHPSDLRRLASALAEAADKADALRARLIPPSKGDGPFLAPLGAI